METEQYKRLRKDILAKNNLTTLQQSEYNHIWYKSFKYQGVKILNDLKKINIYQNNASKSRYFGNN